MTEPSPPGDRHNRWMSGLLTGLLAGLAVSFLFTALTRISGVAIIAVPFLFLGGEFWRRRPFLAAFLLGFSLGGLAQLLRPLLRAIL